MLAISHFSPKKIELILDQALEMADGKKYTAQDEIFVSNLFFEDSTRTKISFEMAERKLGLSVIPFDTSQSSVNKGESLYDTAKTLESIGLNLLVIRHGQNQYYDELKNIKIPIINAGDGTGNHPSQTMLDLMTIKQEFGSFKDLKIAIAGDVKHSRVANSACDILRKLDAKVYFSGPREWFDEGSLMNGTYREIDGLIPEIDVLMLLRIQHERHHQKIKYSPEEYLRKYGLTKEREQKMKPSASKQKCGDRLRLGGMLPLPNFQTNGKRSFCTNGYFKKYLGTKRLYIQRNKINNMKIIKNGKILDQQGNLVQKDIQIENGLITKISENIENPNAEIIDAEGKFISPGFIDVHVHLREPGGEHKETIATGSMAAAKGGYTTICPMPNTNPVPDRAERFDDLLKRIQKSAVIKIRPYGAITEDSKGAKLTDFQVLKEKGAIGFTDDGVGIQEAGVMYEAMQESTKVNLPIVAHCEDNSLILGGCIHDGKKAKELGLKGIPSVCESVHIARDILLAEAAGAHYHVCHVSTKESVRVIADGKKAGIRVTAEVSPHHLVLTEDDIPNADTNYKMNPPLRAKEDQLALIKGLEEGIIDCIATDHAPHTEDEKSRGMYDSPFGIVGFETAFPVLHTRFVKTGKWSLKQLIDWMTIKPAEVFNLDKVGKIEVGYHADLTFIDLEKTQKVNKNTFVSKGRNTPFDGWECTGWPVVTFVNGEKVY